LRSAGDGSCAAYLPPSASRPQSRCGPLCALRQRRATACDSLACRVQSRGGPRSALSCRRIVCSIPATLRLAPSAAHRHVAGCATRCAIGVSQQVTASRPPSCGEPQCRSTPRSAGGGSCAAYLTPSASRPPSRRWLRNALRQRCVTANDRLAPALTWRAALCAQLSADRVQRACHHPPRACRPIVNRSPRLASGVSQHVTASRQL
jgi:hypothetical protein